MLTEYRGLVGTVERAGNGERRLEGLGIPVNQWSEDLGGFKERIAPYAFADSIALDDWRAVYNHNSDRVIGRRSSGTLAVWENSQGVHYRADPPDAVWARDMLISIERGDIRENSFAMVVSEEDWDRSDSSLLQRTVKKARLIELGPQTFPAYGSSSVQVRALQQTLERGRRSVTGSVADLAELRRELGATEQKARGRSREVRAAAYHEAGHAVAYYLAGAGVARVSVELVDGCGHCWPRDASRRTAWSSAAGYIAERLSGHEPGSFFSARFAGDRRNIGDDVMIYAPEGVLAIATTKLRRNWEAVQALAERLIECGEISGERAEWIIRAHVSDSPDPISQRVAW